MTICALPFADQLSIFVPLIRQGTQNKEYHDQLRAEVTTLVFTPDRLVVVKGGPAARRSYFDRVLGRLFPARAGLSAEYGAAVALVSGLILVAGLIG